MNILVDRSENPSYGHNERDAGTHLIFTGPTASGKTYTAIKLLEYLGYNVVRMSAAEILNNYSCPKVDTLLNTGTVSTFEAKLLGADKSTSINPLIFSDEFASQQISEVKLMFDQFSHIKLPALGIEIPAYLNSILASNREELIQHDPAAAARFIHVRFYAKSPTEMKAILLKEFENIIKNHPIFKDQFDEQRMNETIEQYVQYNTKLTLRELIPALENLLIHFKTETFKTTGELYRLEPSRRTGNNEAFTEFLERKLGGMHKNPPIKKNEPILDPPSDVDSGEESFAESSDSNCHNVDYACGASFILGNHGDSCVNHFPSDDYEEDSSSDESASD